eukprot:TRINITY_DN908_c0_g1_i1.p1 TRINITY_DN908_c0_g1~~TRINITY_DN908_c0_g1_i1.p1  ORF type:complete len:314 (+),score=78.92 TRINITY_DN908_c0_g1_i1:117-1058(+)
MAENINLNDYLEAYKIIEQKLKKKFLRKPNVLDSLTQLTQIINSLKRKGNFQYAAFCCLAVARCEQALRNQYKEAMYLVEAGYYFWEAELDINQNNSIGFEENLTEAISCYLLAIKIYLDQKMFSSAAAHYFEMASILLGLEKPVEASEYFNKAAQIQEREQCILSALISLHHSVDCYLLQVDYKNACDTLNKIIALSSAGYNPYGFEGLEIPKQNTSETLYTSLVVESQVSLVLLHILQREFHHANNLISKMEAGKKNKSHFLDSLRDLVKVIEETPRKFELMEIVNHQFSSSSFTPKQTKILQMILHDIGD